MSVKYTVKDQDSIVHITAEGELSTLNHAINHLKSFLQELRKSPNRKALVDHSNVKGDSLSFFEKYDFISLLSEDPTLKALKWALVVPPERTKSLKDFETLIRNRGYSFLGFHSVDDAKEWLTK